MYGQHRSPQVSSGALLLRRLCASAMTLIMACTIIISLNAMPLFAAQAVGNDAPSADLAVTFVDAPSQGLPGEEFSYTVRLNNLGRADAHGARAHFTFGEGVTQAAMTCLNAGSGAACPEDITLNSSLSDPAASFTISVLPAYTHVVFTVSGRYPKATSITPTFRVEVPEGVSDPAPNTNVVQQQIGLAVQRVEVTKTQDKETVASGEERIYTLRFHNPNAVELKNVFLADEYNNGLGDTVFGSQLTWSISCGAGTVGMECPDWADGTQKTSEKFTTQLFRAEAMTFPANATLELVIPLTHTFTCDIYTGNPAVKNHAQVTDLHGSQYSSVDGHLESKGVCERVTITKTQDREHVEPGQVRTYTVRYENPTSTPMQLERISDYYNSGTGGWLEDSVVSWSITCGPNTHGIDCPEWANGGQQSAHQWDPTLYESGPLTLPAGAVLELIVPLTHDYSCAHYDPVHVRNVAVANDAAGTKSGEIRGTLGVKKICGKLDVEVEQNDETLSSGQERFYTLRYTNNTGADLENVTVAAGYNHGYGETVDSSTLRWSVSCGEGTRGIDCPTWADGSVQTTNGFDQIQYNEPIALFPAGAVLEIKVPLTHDFICGGVANRVENAENSVWMRVWTRTGSSDRTKQAVAKVRCEDVSTSIKVSVNAEQAQGNAVPVEVRNGDAVEYAITVQNAAGMAQNVPVVVTLPTMVDPIAVGDITCRVNGATQCPEDLHYDEQRHAIVGTVATMPRNSSVIISARTHINAVGKEVLSSITTVTAPSTWDAYPVRGTDNASSLTFGYIPIVIDVPQAPQPNGVCYEDGSYRWTQPADDEKVRWAVTDEGHLVATAMPAFIFETADGARVRTHDFGVAQRPDGVNCPVPLPPAPTVVQPPVVQPPLPTAPVIPVPHTPAGEPPVVRVPTVLARTGPWGMQLAALSALLLVGGVMLNASQRRR